MQVRLRIKQDKERSLKEKKASLVKSAEEERVAPPGSLYRLSGRMAVAPHIKDFLGITGPARTKFIVLLLKLATYAGTSRLKFSNVLRTKMCCVCVLLH